MTEPKRYRKRPVVVEAMRYDGENYEDIRQFALGNVRKYSRKATLVVCTIEGAVGVDPPVWIVKGVKGEFYPCKPDIFEATYEEVSGR